MTLELFTDRYVYVLVLVLLSIGLYGMFAMRNLAKKVIGMTIFTTAIYLFFIEGSVKEGATAPVIDPALGPDPGAYVDPLPHLLILTAIVVGVGIVGVALALLVRIHRAHGTFDEDAVVARLSGRGGPAGSGGPGGLGGGRPPDLPDAAREVAGAASEGSGGRDGVARGGAEAGST